MRFIRDIIGEKRQMDNAVHDAPKAKQVDDVLSEGILGDPAPKGEAAAAISPQAQPPVGDTSHESDISVDEIENIGSFNGDFPDDIAAFFAEDDEAESAEPRIKARLHEPEPGNPGLDGPALADAQEEASDIAAPIGLALGDAAPEDEVAEQADHAVPTPEPDEALRTAFRDEVELDALDAVSQAPEPGISPAVTDPYEDEALAPLVETEQDPPAKPERPNLFSEDTAPAAREVAAPEPQMPQTVEVPQPAIGRGSSSHGRVKTRLLGFNSAQDSDIDPISDSKTANAAGYTMFPVGWLIVVEGAGRGSAFTLFDGVSNIGRGEDQTVRLDFGDNSISRENHASIAYDPRQKAFFIGHGGKANLVRRNDRPVLSTEEMMAGDLISIGETTLRFVPFCGPDFVWDEPQDIGRAHASQG